jgi:UDP-glucose 4-epimerase
VFASSSSVYGDSSILPVSENLPLDPITPYGVSKLSAERYWRVFSHTYNLATISLRYFNVYGERRNANPYSGVIATFAKQFSKGLRPTIYGDGEQTRDFVHVSDVARANLQALRTERGIGDAFNVGTGQATTINQLFTVLVELFGRPDISPVYSAARQGDIRQSYADLTRSRAILGFETKIEFRRGLELFIESSPKARM